MARGSAENKAAVDPATGKRDVAATGSDAGEIRVESDPEPRRVQGRRVTGVEGKTKESEQ